MSERRFLDLKELNEALSLDDVEWTLVSQSGTISHINPTQLETYRNIYTVKGIAEQVDKMIASNEKMEVSNDKYAKAMNWLTLFLLLATVAQVVTPLIYGR